MEGTLHPKTTEITLRGTNCQLRLRRSRRLSRLSLRRQWISSPLKASLDCRFRMEYAFHGLGIGNSIE